MDCSDCKKFINLLKQEVVPALGCTEPIAVALAAATAKKTLNSDVENIEVWVSANILKNGMGVGIPGTGMTGLDIAAALGSIGGDSQAKLEVLKNINKEHIESAKEAVKEGKVSIKLKDVPNKLYIEVISRNDENYSKVVIVDTHTNITLIEYNGQVVFERNMTILTDEASVDMDKEFASIDNIYDFVTTVNIEDVEFLLDSVKLNKAIAEEGLKNQYGLKVGKTILENIEKGLLGDDIQSYAMALTAAASDARMAGCMMPVMSNSGSGNQGITVTLPIIATAEKLKVGKEQLIRALALGHLIAIHIKTYLGRLSALCGCVVAAAGASCGITYLLGGKLEQVKYATKNMIGNISGMICDGAKTGCALKVSTGTSAAVQSALLAMSDIEISYREGIIDQCIEKTIKNVCAVGNEGMRETDKVILDIMVNKDI